ncbi:MAG: HAD family hydrolase [Verrucomicrobiae bacterium]|nr:HAD family hydrolase [Verrucomicrobiae bacterium]
MKTSTTKHLLIDIDGTITQTDSTLEQEPGIGSDYFRGILRNLLAKKGKAASREALDQIREKEKPFNGCMFKTAPEMGIDADAYWQAVTQWQEKHLTPYPDAVEMVRTLHAKGFQLYVVSNNSCQGILAKLHRAGLAQKENTPYFKRIFGMDVFGRGFDKGNPVVPASILKMENLPPEDTATVGDDLEQDGRIPAGAGIKKAFIIRRNQTTPFIPGENGITFINDLRLICNLCRSKKRAVFPRLASSPVIPANAGIQKRPVIHLPS